MSHIVVSTWRFGLASNQPAWKILKNGGSALDAVVRGVEVAERDPAVKSVGFGGYPNAEGESKSMPRLLTDALSVMVRWQGLEILPPPLLWRGA